MYDATSTFIGVFVSKNQDNFVNPELADYNFYRMVDRDLKNWPGKQPGRLSDHHLFTCGYALDKNKCEVIVFLSFQLRHPELLVSHNLIMEFIRCVETSMDLELQVSSKVLFLKIGEFQNAEKTVKRKSSEMKIRNKNHVCVFFVNSIKNWGGFLKALKNRRLSALKIGDVGG
jgi:hypothetical protein